MPECPRCGTPGAYVGLSKVECANPACNLHAAPVFGPAHEAMKFYSSIDIKLAPPAPGSRAKLFGGLPITASFDLSKVTIEDAIRQARSLPRGSVVKFVNADPVSPSDIQEKSPFDRYRASRKICDMTSKLCSDCGFLIITSVQRKKRWTR